MKPRRRGHRRRIHLEREVELNITAFMNLMVVLVPFLLTTAVFTRAAVLTVDVPTPGPTPEVQPPPIPPKEIAFTPTARLGRDGVTVLGSEREGIDIPRNAAGEYDIPAIREALGRIKAERPEQSAVNIMSRPDTPYAELVAVMDAATGVDGVLIFPDIRLGEFQPQEPVQP